MPLDLLDPQSVSASVMYNFKTGGEIVAGLGTKRTELESGIQKGG